MRHSDVPVGFIHSPFNWLYANAAARLAADGFESGDVNKVALDANTGLQWVVSSVDGGTGLATWAPVSQPTLDKVPAPGADVDLASHKLTAVGDATADTDALNRRTGDARFLPLHRTLDGIDAPAADLSLNGHKAIGAADATAATDLLNLRTGDGRYVGVTAGTPPLVDPSTLSQGAWLKYIDGKLQARSGPFVDPRDGLPGIANTKCACDLQAVSDGVIALGLNTVMTGSTLSTGSPITTLNFVVPGGGLASGTIILLASGSHFQRFTLNGAATGGASSATILSATPNFAYPAGSAVTGLASVSTATGHAGTRPLAVGDMVNIDAAFVAGTNLGGTVLSVDGSGHALLDTPAPAAATGLHVEYGTDDLTPATNLFTNLPVLSPQHVQLQSSMMVSGTIPIPTSGKVTHVPGTKVQMRYGVNHAAFGVSPTQAYVDVTFSQVHLVGDGNPASDLPQTGCIGIIADPIPSIGSSRFRVEDNLIENFAQAAAYVKNCDIVDMARNWGLNCSFLAGGDNTFNLFVTGRKSPATPGPSVVDWTCNENIALNPKGIGACFDLGGLLGQAPGVQGRVTMSDNIAFGSSNFVAIACETNGGARNYTITGNIGIGCRGGISWGDSSGGLFQNSYSDLQNWTITGNIMNLRGVANSAAFGGFASNVTLTGNVGIASAPFSNLGGTPGGVSNNVRSVNVVNHGNVWVTSFDTALHYSCYGSRIDDLNFGPNIVTSDSEVDSIDLTPPLSGVLNQTISVASGSLSTLAVQPLLEVIPGGTDILFATNVGSQVWHVTTTAAIGASSLTVTPQTPNATYTGGTSFASNITGTFSVTIKRPAPSVIGGAATTLATLAVNPTDTPQAITAALQALMPAGLTRSVIALGHGVPATDPVEIQFVDQLSAQPMTVTCDFTGLTYAGGAGAPVVTQLIQGAQSLAAINFQDCNNATFNSGTKVRGSGGQGYLLIDCRDSRIDGGQVLECNSTGASGTAGAGISISGDCGAVGFRLGPVDVYDRRSTPLMTYGVDTSGVTNGRVYFRESHPEIPFWKTAKTNGTTYSKRPGRRIGRSSYTIPTSMGWVHSTPVAVIANRGYFALWIPDEDYIVSSVGLPVAVAATANDNCDVGIYDTTGFLGGGSAALLASNGGSAGHLNAAVTTRQDVPLATPYQGRAGQAYYVAFSCGTIGGTAAQLIYASYVAGGLGQVLNRPQGSGYTVGDLDIFAVTAGMYPLPSTVSAAGISTSDTKGLLAMVNGTAN